MSDFARLLQNEIPRLRRYARALTRDAARADDLVQSCLVRAIAKEHLWEPGTDLRAWLFTILHNQNVNDIRRSVREGVVVAVEDVASVLTVAPRADASLQLRDLERAISYCRKSSGKSSYSWVSKGCATRRWPRCSTFRSARSARAYRAAVKCCVA
jgi:DNA-directed RNA polymerase specialized sigma24 family protein